MPRQSATLAPWSWRTTSWFDLSLSSPRVVSTIGAKSKCFTDRAAKLQLFACDADDLLAAQANDWDRLIFEPPGGNTDRLKLVSSDTRCLVWNKNSNMVHELVLKDVKAMPTVTAVWDPKEDRNHKRRRRLRWSLRDLYV